MKLFIRFSLLVVSIVFLSWLFPFLFEQSIFLQREFHQQLSASLRQISQNSIYTGASLVSLSFIYGVLHALGPGHGKFVIASYVSVHQSKLWASIRLTLLSSLTQGIVAIALSSILLWGLQLSSNYLKLSELWLQRAAFMLLVFLGLQWIWKSGKAFYQQHKKSLKLTNFRQLSSTPSFKLGQAKVHQSHCSCGHQHTPTVTQLDQQGFKAQCLIILSIGMRPCSGAILVLFLAYMLNLYWWGIVAALLMSLGTGLCLSIFTLLIIYARKQALNIGSYFSTSQQRNLSLAFKLLAGVLLLIFAGSLLYGTTLPVTGGAVLFQR